MSGKLQIKPRQNRHHIKPQSRFKVGTSKRKKDKNNIVILNKWFHDRWHTIFENLILKEAYKLVEKYFAKYDIRWNTTKIKQAQNQLINCVGSRPNPFFSKASYVNTDKWQPKLRKRWKVVFGELVKVSNITIFMHELHTPGENWTLKEIKNLRKIIKEYSETEKINSWWGDPKAA